MVRTACSTSQEGKLLNLEGVLKLNYAKNVTIFTSVVSGILESSSYPNDSSYFKPISILAFSNMTRYKYTLAPEEFDEGVFLGANTPSNPSLGLPPGGICWVFSREFSFYKLMYARNCNLSPNCSPLIWASWYLPHFMSCTG